METLQYRQNTHFQKLLKTFQEMPWTDSKFYGMWLAQSYFYTSHSTRMLAYAAGCTTYSQTDYYRRSLQHIREEQGHELLAKRDAEALALEGLVFAEDGSTRALWETQFYKIQKQPEVLLGYILCLEMLAVETFPDLLAILKNRMPELRHDFVRVHAEDDPDHLVDAMTQVNLNSEHIQTLIMQNFEQTAIMYRLMLSEVQNQSVSTFSGHSNIYSTFKVDAQATTTWLES